MEAFFSRRGIKVHNGPPPHILEKARLIVLQLEDGIPYWQLRGKRLRKDRSIISIPVGPRWRLVASLETGTPQLQELVSHSNYNGLL